MTIKLTEEDVREIYKALGFLELTLMCGTIDPLKEVSLKHIDRIGRILSNAPIDEAQ